MILFISDDDPLRLFSARLLRNKKYEALEACTGQAWAVVDRTPKIDLLIVSGDGLRELGGFSFIGGMRERYPDMKILFTGYTDREFGAWLAADPERTSFLAMPFSLKSLAEAVVGLDSGRSDNAV